MGVWMCVCLWLRVNEKQRDRIWSEWGCGIVITSKVITAGWSHALASLKLWSLCKAVVLGAGTEYITQWITSECASKHAQNQHSATKFLTISQHTSHLQKRSNMENIWPNLTLTCNLDRRVQMFQFVFCSQWCLIKLGVTTSATQPVTTILLCLFWIWRNSVKSEKTMTSSRLFQQSFPHKIRGQIGHEMQFSGGQMLWGHSAMFGLQKNRLWQIIKFVQ